MANKEDDPCDPKEGSGTSEQKVGWGDDAFDADHYEKMHEWFGDFSDDEFCSCDQDDCQVNYLSGPKWYSDVEVIGISNEVKEIPNFSTLYYLAQKFDAGSILFSPGPRYRLLRLYLQWPFAKSTKYQKRFSKSTRRWLIIQIKRLIRGDSPYQRITW